MSESTSAPLDFAKSPYPVEHRIFLRDHPAVSMLDKDMHQQGITGFAHVTLSSVLRSGKQLPNQFPWITPTEIVFANCVIARDQIVAVLEYATSKKYEHMGV